MVFIPHDLIGVIAEFSDVVAIAVYPFVKVKPRRSLVRYAIENGYLEIFREIFGKIGYVWRDDWQELKELYMMAATKADGIEYLRIFHQSNIIHDSPTYLNAVLSRNTHSNNIDFLLDNYLWDVIDAHVLLYNCVHTNRYALMEQILTRPPPWCYTKSNSWAFWQAFDMHKHEMVELLYSKFWTRPDNLSIEDIRDQIAQCA